MNTQRPRFLVFQHIAAEHPGAFRTMMDASGVDWTPVELDEGESIPDLGGYDALWVMGGPMDVWQKAEHPWLVDEIAAIREAVVERDLPFFGLCLGHQLLAEALGGAVGVATTPEIGVLDVEITPAGLSHDLMTNVPTPLKALQWHSAEITRLPESATNLMASPVCLSEAMCIGPSQLSMQFHLEIEPDTVQQWGNIPEYAHALARTCGEKALTTMDREARASMDSMTAAAQTIYSNWYDQSFD